MQGEIAYRDRTDEIAPVLSYDLEYFQRFEPNTVGDMLKRVPGMTFVGSDIMEFDGAMMRGMAAGYTQVLINGKNVPGAGDDRSFWVDRIPADLGEEVTVKYGDDLEVFVEKRFGKTISLRLTASNLLDASKDEFFHKFDNQADQVDRDYDEYELETEEAGPSYQLVMRWAF